MGWYILRIFFVGLITLRCVPRFPYPAKHTQSNTVCARGFVCWRSPQIVSSSIQGIHKLRIELKAEKVQDVPSNR